MPGNYDKERWNQPPGEQPWDKAQGADNSEWDEFRRVPLRRVRRKQCQTTPATRLLIAILLIGAGSLMFLSNLGLLPAFNLWDFWPLIFVIGGVGKLTSDRSPSGRAIGGVLVGGGTLFLLMTLGILHVRAHDDSWPLSMLLLTAGAVALIKALEKYPSRPSVGFPQTPPPATATLSPDEVNEHLVLGSINRKINSGNFRGGKLEAILSNIELDLRRAQISSTERSATVVVNAVFGNIEMRVPETWRVINQAAGVFGTVEDKTLANKSPGFDGPALYIVGAAVFGSIEIKD